MTIEEMQQAAINHWRATEPEKFRRWKPETIDKQSRACAERTRAEMDLIKVGARVSEEIAWARSRHLFCLAPMPDPNQITPEELGSGFDPNEGLTPDEYELSKELEEEERSNSKLVATRLDLSAGETAVLPTEMTAPLDRDLKAGETVAVVGQVRVTMVAKMGRSVELLIEATSSSKPRKLPIAGAAPSGVHREMEAGDKLLFFFEESVSLIRDMPAGQTVIAREKLLVTVARRSGTRAKLVFEEPASCETVALPALRGSPTT